MKSPDKTQLCDDIRARLNRCAHNLGAVAQGHGVFADPRGVYLEVSLTIHELEAALNILRRRVLP
jgi:hypothetical protein